MVPTQPCSHPCSHLLNGAIDLLGKHLQLGMRSHIRRRCRQVELKGRGTWRQLALLLRVGLRQGERERGLLGRLPALGQHQVGRGGKGAAGRGGPSCGTRRRGCRQAQQRRPQLQQRSLVARVERLVEQHGIGRGGSQ